MKNEKIRINSEFIRLDDLLKITGIVSTGGQAKMIIQNDGINVNGEKCCARGKKLRCGDKITVNDTIFEICSEN